MTDISFSYIRTMGFLPRRVEPIRRRGWIAVGNGAVVIATQAHQDGLSAMTMKARGVDTAMATADTQGQLRPTGRE